MDQRIEGGGESWRVPDKAFLRASGQVQSLIRSLKLLTALAAHRDGLSLSSAAGKVGLPASTAHRLLSTLQNERFVRYDNDRARWHVGLQAYRVGVAFVAGRDLAQTGRPFVRRLAEATGEAAFLADASSAIVSQAGPKRPVTHRMNATLARLLGGGLAEQRARGYAVFDDDNPVGSRGVAAAVFDEHGRPLAGLIVAGGRLSDQRLAALGEAAKAMAADITAELGGHAPNGAA